MSGRRIGVVVHSTQDGGGESYLRELYGRLGPGWDAEVLGGVPRWDVEGVPVHDIGLGAKWSRRRLVQSLAGAPGELRRASGAIRSRHELAPFALFHAQYKREQLLLTRGLARLAPVVWTEHGRFYRGRGSSALRSLYRRAARATAAITCVSEVVGDDVRSICGDVTEVTVIPNGVDRRRFRPPTAQERREARARFGVEGDEPVALSLGALIPRKSVAMVVEATRDSGVRLLVAGEGPERPRLEASAHSAVTFLGHVDPVPALWASDVFVFGGRGDWGEGMPLVLPEAAAAGLAIAAFDHPGIGSVLAGCPALLLPADDAPAAAAALAADDRLARAEACHRWSEAFDIDTTVAAHRALFERIART